MGPGGGGGRGVGWWVQEGGHPPGGGLVGPGGGGGTPRGCRVVSMSPGYPRGHLSPEPLRKGAAAPTTASTAKQRPSAPAPTPPMQRTRSRLPWVNRDAIPDIKQQTQPGTRVQEKAMPHLEAGVWPSPSTLAPPPPHHSAGTVRVVLALLGPGGGGALEGKGPQRRPQRRLGRRLQEVAEAVGGGYYRLQMPLSLALGAREAVAGHRLGASEGGAPPPSNASLGGCDQATAYRYQGDQWSVIIDGMSPP